MQLQTTKFDEAYYSLFLNKVLSAQEKRLTVRIARLLPKGHMDFHLADVKDRVGFKQHAHISAILTRLQTKMVIKRRTTRGHYEFTNAGFVKYIRKTYSKRKGKSS